MTLVQLRHLISLAETGSFSKSAELLFLTQPALSRSIRSLEAELGQALFDRLGRVSELTPFGHETLARARELVQAADELRRAGQRAAGGLSGRLRVGMGSGPGALLMNPLLQAVAQHGPGLQLEVARAGTELLVQALRARQLDALVVDARSLRPAPDLHLQHLHELRGAFMVRRGHPLAKRRRTLSFEEVCAFGLASTPLSDEVCRVLVERYGPQAHPSHSVTLRCDELPSLVELARHSDTVLLAIRAAAPDLVELRLTPELAANARLGLVTLARRTEAPGLSLVRELMSGLLRDNLSPSPTRRTP
ncbi:LysR family transcriptional regulator [Ideonella paludis]|uniref:LysR family transcriptional regulator n=1 Tax=Ideonella paludis TaxID=1233411 RepID=A0ABS5DT15_9BURK|nr:LysR family transcriptional regulator [Ideonella paludis]MBQ0934291.1 LysR family transcriptional regulator [Ideonella paludis]